MLSRHANEQIYICMLYIYTYTYIDICMQLFWIDVSIFHTRTLYVQAYEYVKPKVLSPPAEILATTLKPALERFST